MSKHLQYDETRKKQVIQTFSVSNFIIFESQQLVICNKPFDIQIDGDRPLTLEKLLKQHRPDIHLRFCHQLDYATSGLIAIAKTPKAAAMANKLFEKRLVIKNYLAILSGHLKKSAIVTEGIAKHPEQRNRMQLCNKRGKAAKTIIKPLKIGTWKNREVTKVLLQPVSGRRHQLRLHCSFIGHPIVGDITYAKDADPYRMMLHSQRLYLPFPEPLQSIDVQTTDPFIKEQITPHFDNNRLR